MATAQILLLEWDLGAMDGMVASWLESLSRVVRLYSSDSEMIGVVVVIDMLVV